MLRKEVSPGNLLLLLLGVASVVLMGYLVYTQFNALGMAREEKNQEKTALARAETRLQQLQCLQEQGQELQHNLAEAERMLPPEDQENVLISELKIWAGSSGLNLQQIRFQNRSSGQGLVEMPFQTVFEGRYSGFLELLNDLQYGPRALRVDGIKIGKGRQELPYLRMEVTASAFYMDETASAQKQ
ncbi:MAG: type 4a pilus biogenesis protein PilO [Syntrophomonadaceae bacterium]|nr:type 4a pilus biogenesis protein PilO [Syntrophomonadaceae bacterium]